ncbi:MAG TPA: hypothetical protein VLA37_10255 [Sphingomonadaceae bacterium]|nr:hypothetical protein [Sphingomonadaceae bacterium]
MPRVERRVVRPFECAEAGRRESVRIRQDYWGFEPIGNGQAPGITTGRGAAGAGAAGLRFAGARFAPRRAAFFFAACFLPARLFDLAI